MRILIAEDDATSRLALAAVLRKNGHEVVKTVNGAEAWHALCQSDAPNLAILDWMMPEMDGLEVIRRVRSLQSVCSPYIILLTARGEKSDVVAGLETGANDHLAKPFDAGELLARVNVGQRMIEMQGALAFKIEELGKSEEKHRVLLEQSSDPIFSCTPEGQYEYVNSTFAREAGQAAEEIVGKNIGDVFFKGEAGRCLDALCRAFQAEKAQNVEINIRTTEGNRCYLTTVNPVKDTAGTVLSMLCSSKDITGRKRMEVYREMGREILQALNEPGGLDDTIQRVLGTLKIRTGFDAVGIRLQDGDDFPYIAHQGFSPDFYLAENSLIGRTIDGGICRDENGNVRLECTCGLVISGKADPADPLFTQGGSFWTNDSLPLLKIPLSQDPRFQPRNQCMHHDYASIALVPIRNKEQIIGLIHCNDRRKGRFTLDSIEALEDIASHIGAALMRKQAEETLRAERKQLRDIVEFLPDATLVLDTAGRVIIWNKAMEKMTGMPAAEMIGKGGHAHAIPFYGETRPQLIDLAMADNEEIASRYSHIIREEDTLVSEVFCNALYNNEGGWVYAKASLLRDQDGNVIGAIESIRDITYRKQMEEKLKKHVAWFRALFDATSDSVMLIKPDGEILDLNNIAALRRNIRKDSMRGQNLFRFLPSHAADMRAKAFEQLFHERRLVQYEESWDDKFYRVRLFPVMDEEGKVIQVASFSRDITENVRAEEDKRKLQAQLMQSQKMEALGTLAGGIAHDFNNILGAIVGFTQMAQVTLPADSAVTQYLGKVLEAGDRASGLVKQILTFCRQATAERILLYPANIARGAIKLLRPSLPSTITIKQRIESNTQPIFADPTQFHQILMNLCTNAFQAMEKTGGILEIALRDCSFASVDLQIQPGAYSGQFVELTVRDSGQGIDPEIRNKIFDPYFTTKEVGRGTGLGLSIVQGIVTSYGGFMTCESVVGEGTIFTIYFPAVDDQAVPELKTLEKIPFGHEHILLVDDDESLIEAGRLILQHLGYKVTIRTSSLEALAIFQEQPNQFDAVITDQTMPGMTGCVLAEHLLRIQPDMPILLCTGYSNLITEEQVKSKGIKEFAMKPLSKRDLALLLRKMLDKHML